MHICRDCQKIPRDELDLMDRQVELSGFLDQSRISPKNRKRIEDLMNHESEEVRDLANLLHQVSLIAEYKRKRWIRVRKKDQALFLRCQKSGLVELFEHDHGRFPGVEMP